MSRQVFFALLSAAALSACVTGSPKSDGAEPRAQGGAAGRAGGDAVATDGRPAATDVAAPPVDTSGAVGGRAGCGGAATAVNPWIAKNFTGVPELTGNFTSRVFLELPRLVRDATASGAKYAFDLREANAPPDPRAALVNVRITNLRSSDEYGAAIQTSDAPGATLYLSNVYIEPNWPAWRSYATTNYDGIVLDGSEAIYAENLTIKNWNADSAMDIKSQRAQFVCLRTEGNGNRTLRFWKAGPHHVVRSSVNNDTGVIFWIASCATTKIVVYDSTFNGQPQVPPDKVSCEDGGKPQIAYAAVDPRTTGELHPMFSAW